MTLEEFNMIDDESKKVLIFEASKIAERRDDCSKFELFNINNFFVEARTSPQYSFKRTMATYASEDLPLAYAGEM